MKPAIPLLSALLLTVPALSGCFGSEATGTFTLLVTDEPNDIGDFSALLVNVSEVKVKVKDSDNRTVRTVDAEFDLVTLQGGNTTTLAEGELPVGDVDRIDISIREARGTLKNGTTITVDVPSGRIFLKASDACKGGAKVEDGKKTEFILDLVVVKEGNGGYKLKPNAGKSGVKGAC